MGTWGASSCHEGHCPQDAEALYRFSQGEQRPEGSQIGAGFLVSRSAASRLEESRGRRKSLRKREHRGLRPRGLQYQGQRLPAGRRHPLPAADRVHQVAGLACGVRQDRRENGELWTLSPSKTDGITKRLCGVWSPCGTRRKAPWKATSWMSSLP